MTHKNAQHFAHENELDARHRPHPSPDHKTAFKSQRNALQFVAAPVARFYSLSLSFAFTVILAPNERKCQTSHHGQKGQRTIPLKHKTNVN